LHHNTQQLINSRSEGNISHIEHEVFFHQRIICVITQRICSSILQIVLVRFIYMIISYVQNIFYGIIVKFHILPPNFPYFFKYSTLLCMYIHYSTDNSRNFFFFAIYRCRYFQYCTPKIKPYTRWVSKLTKKVLIMTCELFTSFKHFIM
jgi:hypothetical protein